MSDITGQKFGKLLAIREIDGKRDKHDRKEPHWLFLCECGKEKIIKKANVINGNSNSCGCNVQGYSKLQKEKIQKYLTKENLEKYIPIYSANYIAKKLFAPDFTTGADTVIKKAKSFGIKTKTYSESRSLKNTNELIKQTCINRYGVESVSSIPYVKESKIKSSIERYGCENVFQSEEIKEKMKQTLMEKYGVEKIGYLGLNKSTGKLSKFHIKVQAILDKNNIKYKSEVHGKFIKYNEFLQNDYSPIVDILLEESKLVIECNGDFWHANPKFYKEDDVFDTWEGKKIAKQIWDKDKSRTEQIESFGYKVLVIWQSEYDNDFKKTEKRILNAVKNSKNKKTKRKTNKI